MQIGWRPLYCVERTDWLHLKPRALLLPCSKRNAQAAVLRFALRSVRRSSRSVPIAGRSWLAAISGWTTWGKWLRWWTPARHWWSVAREHIVECRSSLTGRAQFAHEAGGVWDEWYASFPNDRWGWLAEAQGKFYLTFARSSRRGTVLPDPKQIELGHKFMLPGVGQFGGQRNRPGNRQIGRRRDSVSAGARRTARLHRFDRRGRQICHVRLQRHSADRLSRSGSDAR